MAPLGISWNPMRVLRLCRNLQVLGAYSYLGLVKGKRHFLQYLPRAWRQLCYWMNDHGGGQLPGSSRDW